MDSETEQDEDDIEVTSEGLCNFLGTPAPCRIFLGKATSAEEPSPFWQASKTEAQDEANTVVMHVVVSVSFIGELQGDM